MVNCMNMFMNRVAQTFRQINDEFLRVQNRKHMIFWAVKSCLHFGVEKITPTLKIQAADSF